MGKRWYIVILLGGIAFVLAVWAISIDLKAYPAYTTLSLPDDGQAETGGDTIAIPGYEGLELQANRLEQAVSLYNPAQNHCYFQISLYLADGTLLWNSDYIRPGETSSPIVLTQALPPGNYPNAILRYSCFQMDGQATRLNGAQAKLTLRVK